MRRLVYHATAWLLRAPLLPFSKVRVLHVERANEPGACLLASNHISHFDPPLIATVVRRHIHWMATAGLFKNPIVGTWLRAAAAFPIDRGKADRSSVKSTLDRLKRGHMVGVFPEGGIRDGAASILGGARMIPGIAAIAEMSGARILPCVILGSDRLYARSTYRLFRRRIAIWIGFGEPLQPTDKGKLAREALETELAERMRALSREMAATFHLSDDDLPQPPWQRMQAARK
jgi:1-acyl-sn-glycerol-3-phosphate acyltransferase